MNSYQDLCQAMALPSTFHHVIDDYYRPLAREVFRRRGNNTLLVSINGAQGSGKTTLTRFLHAMLEREHACRVASFSLDDFYLQRVDRELLAQQVHPLLRTRGVPGTHDIDLLEATIASLLNRESCRIPVFDKAIDDRMPSEAWRDLHSGCDIILFEGWCNNSPAQNAEQLREPVNELEAKEDSGGQWRHYVNDKLIEYHARIYHQSDLTIFLQAPDFEQVFQWRKLQEDKLRATVAKAKGHFLMDDTALRRFLQHYERITRHTLATFADCADIVLPLNIHHDIVSMSLRNSA